MGRKHNRKDSYVSNKDRYESEFNEEFKSSELFEQKVSKQGDGAKIKEGLKPFTLKDIDISNCGDLVAEYYYNCVENKQSILKFYEKTFVEVIRNDDNTV